MAQNLDQFVADIKTDIEAFAADYRARHEENPEHYQLELGDNNSGLWIEFFVDFITRGPGPVA